MGHERDCPIPDCRICRDADFLVAIERKCSGAERDWLNEVLARLEAAETEAQFLRGREPRWSKSPPVVVGYYWWRNPDYPPSVDRPSMVPVRELRGGLVCDEPLTRPVSEHGGEWAGPVLPPEARP